MPDGNLNLTLSGSISGTTDGKSGFYAAENNKYLGAYVADIPRKVRVIYFNPVIANLLVREGFCRVKALKANVEYCLFFLTPVRQ